MTMLNKIVIGSLLGMGLVMFAEKKLLEYCISLERGGNFDDFYNGGIGGA